jgi:hypothetical protein
MRLKESVFATLWSRSSAVLEVSPRGRADTKKKNRTHTPTSRGILIRRRNKTNCIGSTPCGGLAKSWDILHPTKSLCIFMWEKDCLGSI